MTRYCLLLLIPFSMLLSGCTSTGAFVATNQTNVVLDQANYVIAATNVSGDAESAYVLGVSFSSFGMVSNTFAVARVSGSGMLYQEALEELWTNFEQQYGGIEGRNLALANVRYDTDILNLLLYTKVRVAVRADVIEFND